MRAYFTATNIGAKHGEESRESTRIHDGFCIDCRLASLGRSQPGSAYSFERIDGDSYSGALASEVVLSVRLNVRLIATATHTPVSTTIHRHETIVSAMRHDSSVVNVPPI